MTFKERRNQLLSYRPAAESTLAWQGVDPVGFRPCSRRSGKLLPAAASNTTSHAGAGLPRSEK